MDVTVDSPNELVEDEVENVDEKSDEVVFEYPRGSTALGANADKL